MALLAKGTDTRLCPLDIHNQIFYLHFLRFSDRSNSNKDQPWLQRHWQLHRSSWRPDAESDDVKDFRNIRSQSLMFNMKPRKVYAVPTPGNKQSPYNRTTLVKPTTDERSSRKGKNISVRRKNRRRKRDVILQMPERTVETLVVVDRMMYTFHKTENVIEPYVLTIMNIVCLLYF